MLHKNDFVCWVSFKSVCPHKVEWELGLLSVYLYLRPLFWAPNFCIAAVVNLSLWGFRGTSYITCPKSNLCFFPSWFCSLPKIGSLLLGPFLWMALLCIQLYKPVFPPLYPHLIILQSHWVCPLISWICPLLSSSIFISHYSFLFVFDPLAFQCRAPSFYRAFTPHSLAEMLSSPWIMSSSGKPFWQIPLLQVFIVLLPPFQAVSQLKYHIFVALTKICFPRANSKL